MSRFSQFAVAAAAQAIEDSRAGDRPTRTATTSRWWSTPAAAGSATWRSASRSSWSRAASGSARSWCRCSPPPWPPARSASRTALRGPVVDQRGGLRLRRAGVHRGAAHDRARRRRRRHRRRHRERHPAGRLRRAGQHGRPLEAQRRPGSARRARSTPIATASSSARRPACCVVEALEHAERARRHGSSPRSPAARSPATPSTSAPPTRRGTGAARAMERALRDADIEPEQVDYVVAHGTSTPLNDATETKAIRAAFGDHADRAGGEQQQEHDRPHARRRRAPCRALAAVLAIRDGVIPPTINYETPDPACDLDYVPNEARQVAGQRGHHQRLRLRRPERGRRLPPPELTHAPTRGREYAPRGDHRSAADRSPCGLRWRR